MSGAGRRVRLRVQTARRSGGSDASRTDGRRGEVSVPNHATPGAINATYRSAPNPSRFRKDRADKLPLMARGRQLHNSSTRVLSIVMIVIGIALIVRTLAAGGGAVATGIVLGVLFVFAGLARLYLQLRG